MASPIEYVEHAPDVLAVAARAIRAGEPLCLVASVSIKGGSARDCGSLAAVTADGTMHGYLSNGCIDRDIQLRAVEALETGAPRHLRYGAGSPFMDLRLPCGGALGVLVDPAPGRAALLAAADALAAREEAELTFHLPDGAGTVRFGYLPKFRLYVAGRGAVFRATARMAVAAGFETHALGPDAEDLDAVADVLAAPPERLTRLGPSATLGALDAQSGFVTLFHDHEWEIALLQQALGSPARFIGSMGSQRTHAARSEALRLAGVGEAEIARVRGPLGLVPSLRDAQLLAASTLAEIASLGPNAILARPVERAA